MSQKAKEEIKVSLDCPCYMTILVDIMLGNLVVTKYSGQGSTIVDVHINGTLIKNTLINLGANIYVMTR